MSNTADDIGSGTWTVTVSGYAVGTTQNVKYGIKREIEIQAWCKS